MLKISRQQIVAYVSVRFSRGSSVCSIDLPRSAYSTHTLPRTKVTILYRKTDNLRAIQLLLGHPRIDSTVRYLGVEVEDALELAESIEL